MTRKEFEKLTKEQQWQWVIDNKEKIKLIQLDNDATSIQSDCFIIPEDEECCGSIDMKADIGNRHGIDYLLAALQIKSEGV